MNDTAGVTANRINFTTIDHVARFALDLTANEYMVAELIYHLSNNPDSNYPNWCYASRTKLGQYLHLTEKSIRTIITILERKGVVEKHLTTKHLKTTQLWYDTVVIRDTVETTAPRKKLPANAVETSVDAPEETTAPIYDNNIYNNNNTKRESSLQFLIDLPGDVSQTLTRKYQCSQSQLLDKAESLLNYCQAHGKKYKNYQALLENALRKDFGVRQESDKKNIVWTDDGGFYYE